MELDRKIEALFARYRRDAVLVHRLFPPHAPRAANSRLGGLPNLPDHHDWPCTSGGRPLHFLAQIDCAEIPFSTPLPDRGVLFFFARDDEEQLWGFDGRPEDDCRVLYALDAFARTPRRAPPPNLPAVGGYYGRVTHNDVAIGAVDPKGVGPNVHVEWPVQFHRIDSWPEPDAYSPEQLGAEGRTLFQRLLSRSASEWNHEEFYNRYRELLEHKQAAELAAATGRPLGPHILARAASGRSLFGPADRDAPFPDYWVYIHFFARLALHRHHSEERPPTEEEVQLDDDARDWLERSRGAALGDPVAEDDRRAFRAWARDIERGVHVPHDQLPARAADFVHGAAVWAIRTWAHDEALARRIPPAVYAATESYLASDFADATTDREGRPTAVFTFQFAQLLGHAPATQEAMAVDDPILCLLNLRSDTGLPWMFGDVGECTFWISPEHLARRDFTKVRLTMQGH